MLWQLLLTTLIVAGCATYALWSLLPAALRRRWRARLRGEPAPAAGGAACGGCDGCGGDALPPPRTARDVDGQAAPAPPREAVIHIFRRPPGAAPGDAPTSSR